MELELRTVEWELVTPFRIAYRTKTHAKTVVTGLRDGEMVGRGEAQGVSYHGESVGTMLEQLQLVSSQVREGLSQAELLSILPSGGARNALDCALWDLEAKRTGRRVWDLLGMSPVRPLVTAYTLGIDSPEAMAEAAAVAARYSLLKIKLNGEDDLRRVEMIRRARPDARLIVDANQAWSEQQLHDLAPRMAQLGVQLIEQPLAAGQDDGLLHFESPVPLCADESCQTTSSLIDLIDKYDFVNIKLDKTGGLTEALRLARAARQHGFKLMVGCMGGSSLAMAPAFVVGQLCDVVDLDGPLLAKHDVADAIRYDGDRMSAPSERLWG